jgi:5-methylcytosine-specific restriction endonuclease McrA
VIAVSEADSISDVLQALGLRLTGGNPLTIKKRIAELGLSTGHFQRKRQKEGRESTHARPSPEGVFVYPSRKKSGNIAKFILRWGLKPYSCEQCGNEGKHNSKPLRLQLDHIDGDTANNTLSNLRFLCPNCHSQTETFAGRSASSKRRKLILSKWEECRDLGEVIAKCGLRPKTVRSILAAHGIEVPKMTPPKKFKIEWPSIEELTRLVWEAPVTHVARDLGVSGTSVKNHCSAVGVPVPPRGYWAKKYAEQIEA